MKKTEACIWLSPADRATLEGWVSGRNTPQKLVWRARIVLQSADRAGVMAITRAAGVSKVTVGRWQERYLAKGIAGLRRDGTRPGRKPPLSAATIQRVVHKTLHEKPAAGTHWSIRKMAGATGLSYSSVAQPCPPPARPGQARGRPRSSRPHLCAVHRGFRRARSDRSQGTVARARMSGAVGQTVTRILGSSSRIAARESCSRG